MKIIGIDVGLGGCIAFMSPDDFILTDMPVLELEKNGKKRRRIDTARLVNVLKDLAPDHAYIELVNALPTNGAAHSFTFGFGAGVVEGVVAALGIPFTMVSPMKWKKEMGCPADKDGARHRASQLLPQHAHNWSLKKHNDRAEASIIALWGARQSASQS